MKKYFCFFKLRFVSELQYRMASVTALTTQLIWGLMECLAYKAIAEASGGNLPMNYSSIVTYIWLKEALLFLLTMFLALGITVAFCMLVYMLCFFTISPQGWRMVLTGAVDFLSGNIIPLPFFPKKYLFLVELSPFAYMQNVPFRIYSGDLAGGEIYPCILKQIFWLVTLMFLGIVLCKQAEKRIIIQGG